MSEPVDILKKSFQRKATFDVDYGKLPPQNRDLEEAVIGAIMIEKTAISYIANELQPELFYVDAHQHIVTAILQLYKEKSAIDLLTITEQLKANGTLDRAGGPFAIAQISNKVGSCAHIEDHMKIIMQKAIARALISSGTEQIKEAYEDTTDVFELVDKCRKAFTKIEQLSVSGRIETTESMADEALAKLESDTQGTPSSHSAINANIGGWVRGHLVVIAARPGMGKTAFHVSELVNLCLNGWKCGSINLEMLKLQFFLRTACKVSGVMNHRVKQKTWGPNEKKDFYDGWNTIRNMKNLHLDFEAGQSISTIANKIRRWKFEHGLDICFVDHLQFIRPDATAGKNKDEQIGDITRALKKIAKDEDICIVLFSHVNRSVEDNPGKRPYLSNLRESGNIENDADVVMFFVRPEYYYEKRADGTIIYNGPEEEAFRNIVQVFCDKHRDGPTFDTEWNCYLGTNHFKDIYHIKTEPPGVQTEIPLNNDDSTPF